VGVFLYRKRALSILGYFNLITLLKRVVPRNLFCPLKFKLQGAYFIGGRK